MFTGVSSPRPSCSRPAFALAATAFALIIGIGCRQEQRHDAQSTQSGVTPTSTDPASDSINRDFRIVCLSPALTDILINLGLADRIVGRDNFEVQLPDSVPRVGDLTILDLEAIIGLAPSDIVVQAGRRFDGAAPPALSDLASRRGWNIVNIQIDSLADVSRVIASLPAQLGPHFPDADRESCRTRSAQLIKNLDAALAPLDPSTANRLGPILLLYGLDPPSAFGPGSYLSDMLTRLGGRNAIFTGSAWQELDLEGVMAVGAWAVIVTRPGADTADSSTIASHPTLRAALKRAAAEGAVDAGSSRVRVLTHPHALLPGASLIHTADELRAILMDLAQIHDSESDMGPDR